MRPLPPIPPPLPVVIWTASVIHENSPASETTLSPGSSMISSTGSTVPCTVSCIVASLCAATEHVSPAGCRLLGRRPFPARSVSNEGSGRRASGARAQGVDSWAGQLVERLLTADHGEEEGEHRPRHLGPLPV